MCEKRENSCHSSFICYDCGYIEVGIYEPEQCPCCGELRESINNEYPLIDKKEF